MDRFRQREREEGKFVANSDKVTTHADVAQLVEHHLAKVRVASSNLVVRSIGQGMFLSVSFWSINSVSDRIYNRFPCFSS